MAAPTLPDAVAQLYAGLPADFVRSRDALVAAAKKAQDPELAARIKALRRPSAAAHLINRLSAAGDLGVLTSLGERLRAAQSQLDAPAMKTLGVERHQLIDDLTERACAEESSVTSAVQEQLRATFTAALADPQAGRAVESGALVTALSYSGFGEVDLSDALATPLTLLQGGRSSTDDDAPDGDVAEADGDRRKAAQHDAARRAAAARSAREQARLERADDAVQTAQQALDRAQARLDEARSAVRDAKATLERAQADRRTAQERVAQVEQENA